MMEKMVQKSGGLKKSMVLATGFLVLLCASGSVQANSRFQEVAGSNGAVVRDSHTGLEWQRCVYGQVWTGSSCSGMARKGSWYYAVKLTDVGGFRLPTIDELKQLAPLDRDVFRSPLYPLWSSTTYPNKDRNAFGIDFNNGGSVYGYGKKNYSLQVRLVRGGQ